MRRPAQCFSITTLILLSLTLADSTPRGTAPLLAQEAPIQENQRAAATQLLDQGFEQFQNHQFSQALQSWEQALEKYRRLEDRSLEAFTLDNLGSAYNLLNQPQRALEVQREALAIQTAIANPHGMASALSGMASSYENLHEYERAIEVHQQALTIYQTLGERLGESLSLRDLGNAQYELEQYERAIESQQQSWTIALELGNAQAAARSGNDLGETYVALKQYEPAIEIYQASRQLAESAGDQLWEAKILHNLGNAHRAIAQASQAIQAYQQALALYQERGNRNQAAKILNNLAWSHFDLGQYEQALTFHRQSLAVHRDRNNRSGQAASLHNLGATYAAMTRYEEAVALYQQSLMIKRDIGDRPGVARSLGNLGSIYRYLGEYEQAIDFHQQALAIQRELDDRPAQSITLNNLGNVYQSMGLYEQSIEWHQQALVILGEIGNLRSVAGSIGNLGSLSYLLGQPEQALAFHNQSLAIQQEVGDRLGEARSLGNLAIVYKSREDYGQALALFQRSVGIAQQIGDRELEAITLYNIGNILVTQAQPELAIAFLKQSVQVSETIRADIQGLETRLQQSYTDTVANQYRYLAEQLLEQGRIPEAQQVLDLLKLEELREFSQQTRATWTSQGLQYTAAEQRVVDAHGDLIAFGQTLYACEQSNCEQLEQLQKQQKELVQQYDQQVVAFEATVRANRNADSLFSNPESLNREAQSLLAANPNSVLIYPLVTEDKLWLLYATAGGSQGSNVGTVEIDVSQAELSQTVQELGKYLTAERRLTKLKAISQQLHGWIIEPLEAALETNDIEHLIFVNDRVTRYIPMAALFDGEQYLLERYTVSSVLSPALTENESILGQADSTQILGLGLTQAVEGFSPLPAVADELDRIVRSDSADPLGKYPGQVHLNDAFTLERLKAEVANHRVLHIATHANFVPGRPDASYIVLGNGEHWRIPEIDRLGEQLRNLHLVVLSACQTALGGKAEDGTEIAGLSAYFLAEGRAESVIASLWSVNDNSTSLLMQRFYELMASGKLTKAEALREAQLSLLYDQTVETRLEQRSRGFEFKPAESELETDSISEAAGLAHPYYWAPFILIGNGL